MPSMSRATPHHSRRKRFALALAALGILAACFTGEVEFRPIGVPHELLWGAGIVLYALLLKAALGPVVDWRESHRLEDASGSGERRTGTGL